MGIFLGIFIAIISILTVLVLRSLTTFFHEMGHAIPALIFSKDYVHVYVGTYGNISNCSHFKFGRLEIFFRLNLLDWKIGMCEHVPTKEMWKTALIILGGPIASLIISLPLIWILANYEVTEVLFLIMSMFVLAASFDFLVNMTPWNTPIYMHNGHVSFCDGYMLLAFWARAFSPKEYRALEELFLEKKYRLVQDKAEELISAGNTYRRIYDLGIQASMVLQKSAEALWFYEKLNEKHKLQSVDFMNIAKLYLEQKREEDALQCLNQCIHLQHNFIEALLERGIIRAKRKDYQSALNDFNMAIFHGPENGHFYVHRASAKIQTKDFEGALKDLNAAQNLGEESKHLRLVWDDLKWARGN